MKKLNIFWYYLVVGVYDCDLGAYLKPSGISTMEVSFGKVVTAF